MRLALSRPVLRRPADPTPEDAAPPAPQPPRGRAVVAFAGVLDGRHLWLAVHAGPGSLALRAVGDAEAQGGDVVALASEVPDDDPAHRHVRVDLEQLGGSSYDAVLVPAGGASARPVWSHPLPAPGPVRTPDSLDGSHRWDLERTDDGGLRVVRRDVAPTVALRAAGLDGETLTLSTEVPAGHDADAATPRLRLLDDDGALVAALPMTHADGLLHARVSLADLPPGPETYPRVLVGDLPVLRHRDDLVRHQASSMLPQLFGDDPDAPVLRLRWLPEGRLGLRAAARPDSRGTDA